MPVEDFFARLLPEFARRATSAQDAARSHADAVTMLASAEYEFYDTQRELLAALAVPLRDRAVKVAAVPDTQGPETLAPADGEAAKAA